MIIEKFLDIAFSGFWSFVGCAILFGIICNSFIELVEQTYNFFNKTF